MNIILSDNGLHLRFAPLTLTRPVGDLRMGIWSNTERWLFYGATDVFYDTEEYLQGKFPNSDKEAIKVMGNVIVDQVLAAAILALPEDSALIYENMVLACRGNGSERIQWLGEKPLIISNRWHLYEFNHVALENDFNAIVEGRTSQPLSDTNTLIGDPSRLFIEEGASVEASILNVKNGPIYVGRDAEIMEGSIVRGGLAMLDHSALKMGTKIYGAVTLGPQCKVGGEVSNSIFYAYSNKGHDGFLGNALVGEWCNMGADTNTSNLKNNYGLVSTYSYETAKEEKTDVQFMGVCMADHSKCGINTMFNTATVIGVSCNIFGSDFPNKYVPSFSWGGTNTVPFKFDKAIEYANNMMARRGKQLSDVEIVILQHILNQQL